MIVNLLLNYLLIDRRFGFPALCVREADIATVTVASLLLGLLLVAFRQPVIILFFGLSVEV